MWHKDKGTSFANCNIANGINIEKHKKIGLWKKNSTMIKLKNGEKVDKEYGIWSMRK